MVQVLSIVSRGLLTVCGLISLILVSFLWPIAVISRPSLRGAADAVALRSVADANSFGVYLDGSTFTPVPRKILDGTPAEMFYSIPIASNPSVAGNKSGYAFIPKLVTLKVQYVRQLQFIGEFEYGVANWKWNANPLSVFSDKIVAGTAEKMLTLSHKGFWRTDSKDIAQNQHTKQSSFTRWLASTSGWYRSFLVNSFTVMANPGVQLRDAALTEDTYRDLRNYAVQDDSQPSEHMRERMSAWRSNLTAEASKTGQPSSFDDLEQTAVNCFHVEGTTGAYWSDQGLFLPLGKKIPVYRGQIAQGPLRTFSIASGIAIVEYNEMSNQLEIYFYANNYLNVFDPQVPNIAPPTLYTSPLPGQSSGSIVPDTRVNTVMKAPSTAMKALYDQYMAMPSDYEYLFRDPAELCGDDKRRKWADMFRTLDFGKFVHGHGGSPGAVDALNMVREMTDTIDCATSYLQAKVPHSNAYDLMEAIGWAHFIMETPPNDTIKVTAYKHWNDFTVPRSDAKLMHGFPLHN